MAGGAPISPRVPPSLPCVCVPPAAACASLTSTPLPPDSPAPLGAQLAGVLQRGRMPAGHPGARPAGQTPPPPPPPHPPPSSIRPMIRAMDGSRRRRLPRGGGGPAQSRREALAGTQPIVGPLHQSRTTATADGRDRGSPRAAQQGLPGLPQAARGDCTAPRATRPPPPPPGGSFAGSGCRRTCCRCSTRPRCSRSRYATGPARCRPPLPPSPLVGPPLDPLLWQVPAPRGV